MISIKAHLSTTLCSYLEPPDRSQRLDPLFRSSPKRLEQGDRNRAMPRLPPSLLATCELAGLQPSAWEPRGQRGAPSYMPEDAKMSF